MHPAIHETIRLVIIDPLTQATHQLCTDYHNCVVLAYLDHHDGDCSGVTTLRHLFTAKIVIKNQE